MDKNAQSNRKALGLALAVAGVLIVLVLIVLFNRRKPEIITTPVDEPVEETLVAEAALPPTPTPAETASAPVAEQVEDIEVMPVAADTLPTPSPTFNPEDQPRETHLLDFRNLASLPEGYELDGVVLTDKGFQLPPPKPGEEDVPRFGTLESPVYEFEFPSNAASPLWLEDLPEGSNIFIELEFSPDGETWSIWHPIEPDDDASVIPPTFEDGRPNPNGGHTAGGVLFWGMREFKYYRFRATLSTENENTPNLGTFHLFYQDSTFGEGHIAELNEDEIQR